MGFIVRPSAWEVQHARGIFEGQAYQAQNGGQLPDTPMWRMLEFRYSVNAARFTYFHPNIGRMIEQKLTPPAPVTPVDPPPVDPPPLTPPVPLEPPVDPPPITPPPVDPPPITPPVDPPPDGGQIITPPPDGGGGGVVPEPSAFSMLLVSVVVVGVFCLHLTKRVTGRETKQPAPSA